MSHYKGSINLLKLEKAGITEIRGKKCVVIPIEENDIFCTENGAAYLTVMYWDNDGVDQYGKSHTGQQVYSQTFRTSHPDARPPRLGALTPIEKKGGTRTNTEASTPVNTSPTSAPKNVGSSDLPF